MKQKVKVVFSKQFIIGMYHTLRQNPNEKFLEILIEVEIPETSVLQYSRNHTDTDTDTKKQQRKVSKKPKNA